MKRSREGHAASFRLLALALVTIALFSPHTSAQERSGRVQGQIRDQAGAAIPDAQITIVRGGFDFTVRTNERGGFTMAGLRPGRYSIRISAPGFVPLEIKTVDVTAETLALPIELQVAGTTQEVTVTTDLRLSIDADNSATMLVLRGASLDALPDGPGGLEAALQMMTSRAGSPQGPNIAVNGFPGARIPPKQSIREIRINQNGFSAQYDQPGLGRVEILTKPGTETVRGGLYTYFNDKVLNSRNPFAAERSAFQTRLMGANLSGPVVRGHASFFADFDRVENQDNAVVNATILDDALNPVPFNRTILTPLRRTSTSPRLDFRINENHTLVGRYSFSKGRSTNLGIGDFSLPTRAHGTTDLNHTFQLTETAILSASVINELRLQYLEDYRRLEGESSAPGISVPQAFVGGGSELGVSSERRHLIEIDNNTMWIAGNHALKTGIRARTVSLSSVSPSNFTGTYTFAGKLAPQLSSNDAVINGADGRPIVIPITTLESYRRTLFFARQGLSGTQIRALGGGAAQFSIAAGTPGQSLDHYDAGAYLQDDWQLVRNLTLSFGARAERQSGLARTLDVAPRVGIAWSPSTSQDAKLVIRGGAGFFYDRFNERLILLARRFNGINQQQYVVTDANVLNSFPATPSLSTLASFRVPSAVTRLSDTIRAPYMMQATLGVERALPFNISMSGTYVYSLSTHALRSRNVNAPLPGSAARPVPGAAEIFQYESSGRFLQRQFVLNATQRLGRRLTYYGTYIFNHAFSDTDGQDTFPASTYNLAAEWGRSTQDVRHTFYWGGWITGPLKLDISPSVIFRSGAPFNIVTGFDTDGDTLYLERPSFAAAASADAVAASYGLLDLTPAPGDTIIPRNFGRGPGFVTAHLKVGRTFNMAASPSRNYSFTLSVQIQNLFNHTNAGTPVGNLSSPQFGRSYYSVGDFGFGSNGAGNRRVEAQVYFGF